VKHLLDDTIAAIATPPGVGGVGIVRVSGPQSLNILRSLFVSSIGSKIESHRMLHGWLINPKTRNRIDEIMSCYMKGPKSFTGEDVVEFYCHGGSTILKNALSIILENGTRLAEKGEFSKRAFLSGRLDLAQAEAILDLISANGSAGAGYALQQLEGKLSKQVSEVRQRLLERMSELEVAIDFSEDVGELDHIAFSNKLSSDLGAIEKWLSTYDAGRMYRNGIATAIIGKPNVGKSSLLNALLGEDRAIVSELPGTTRDSIEESVGVGELVLKIVDTAGLRHPKDRVEEFGVSRTRRELQSSELALVVLDGSAPIDGLDSSVFAEIKGKNAIIIINKSDLPSRIDKAKLKHSLTGPSCFNVSALTGKGILELKYGIYNMLVKNAGPEPDSSVLINARHRECLLEAKNGLSGAILATKEGRPAEIVAIDLKEAIIALGKVTGEVVSEEVINAIFEQFCVGK
jgi:tRNA modification GTPase